MKTLTKFLILMTLVPIGFIACKKKSSAPVGPLGANFPSVLNTIITPAILDTLEKHGLIVNAGLTPATVNGIYLLSPNVCQYDNSNYYSVGQVIDNYKYEFMGQNNSNFTINIHYEDASYNVNTGVDSAATYISGLGNSFTIYAQIQGVLSGVSYTSLELYSGTITSTGIANFQNAVYIQSKVGDATNSVAAPVGTIRIFKDGDGLSVTQTTFSAILKQLKGGSSMSLFASAAQKSN